MDRIFPQPAGVSEFLVAKRLHLRARSTGWLMFRLERRTIFLNHCQRTFATGWLAIVSACVGRAG